MDRTQAFEKLRSIGQQHILHYFDALDEPQQKKLLQEIEDLNIPRFRMQQQMLPTQNTPQHPFIEPYQDHIPSGGKEAKETGEAQIAEGRAGCILIAGGQGTRLRAKGPKGAYPVTLFKKKSLFQIFAEKTIAAGKKAGRLLPLAVMTSPQNHDETIAFFKANHFFNLDHRQLHFFSQGMLPLLDREGNLFLEAKGQIASGPDGNGTFLTHFLESGIWEAWYGTGVRCVNCVLIDNPLADPFDAELIGHLHLENRDLVVKCAKRRDANEKVGVIVRQENKLRVIEYTELTAEEREARDPAGGLLHPLANLSLFCQTMDFMKKASKAELPFHLAEKAVRFVDGEGSERVAEAPNAWKFEKFLFDIFPLALNAKAVVYPREECFAPLKNPTGEAGPEAVQQALIAREKQLLAEITGTPPPKGPIELAQDFYYPTEELIRRWRGKTVEQGGFIPSN